MLVRVLRLVRLMKLFKPSRLVKRWETHIAINYSMLKIILSMIR